MENQMQELINVLRGIDQSLEGIVRLLFLMLLTFLVIGLLLYLKER